MKSVYFKINGLTEEQLKEMYVIMLETGAEVYDSPKDNRGYPYYGIDEEGDIIFWGRGSLYKGGVEVEPTPTALREALGLTTTSRKGEWIAVDGAKALPIGIWLVEVEGGVRYVAVKRKNLTLVGNRFHFDMSPVISYYNVDVYSI